MDGQGWATVEEEVVAVTCSFLYLFWEPCFARSSAASAFKNLWPWATRRRAASSVALAVSSIARSRMSHMCHAHPIAPQAPALTGSSGSSPCAGSSPGGTVASLGDASASASASASAFGRGRRRRRWFLLHGSCGGGSSGGGGGASGCGALGGGGMALGFARTLGGGLRGGGGTSPLAMAHTAHQFGSHQFGSALPCHSGTHPCTRLE